jgi:hypothetical protein
MAAITKLQNSVPGAEHVRIVDALKEQANNRRARRWAKKPERTP